MNRSVSILYVEDEENVRAMLSRFLQRFCQKLYVAKDGQEGLELYKKHNPDIIISDIKMPKMSGLEMIKEIKQINPSQLVLLLSAHSDSEYLFDAINLNVDGYILKPVDLDAVNEKLRNLIIRINNKKAAKKLQESEEKFRTIAEISLTGIFIYQETFVYVNQAFCELTGYTREELYTMKPWEILAKEDAQKIKKVAQQRLKGEKVNLTNISVKVKTKQEHIKIVKVSATTMPYEDGYAGTGNMIDITDVIETKSRLELLSQAIDQMDEMVQITDIDGNIIYVNPSTINHTLFTEDELIGTNNRIFQSGKHTQEFYKKFWKTILEGNTFHNIFINKKKDGTLFYDEKVISPLKNENGDIRYFIATSRDISRRIALEEKLKHLATVDALTGIYNRYKINTIIEDEIKRVKRYEETFSLLMFDIDYFKKVNDTYGHDVGDYVLQDLSRIVLNTIRNTDSFGRWGGEEFMLVAPYTKKEDALFLAEKIRKNIESYTFKTVGKVTVSIGVTLVHKEDSINTLIKRVDNALYEAKANGRNQVVFL
ncbi:diguanylate cyclase [Sulfurimonas sp.]